MIWPILKFLLTSLPKKPIGMLQKSAADPCASFIMRFFFCGVSLGYVMEISSWGLGCFKSFTRCIKIIQKLLLWTSKILAYNIESINLYESNDKKKKLLSCVSHSTWVAQCHFYIPERHAVSNDCFMMPLSSFEYYRKWDPIMLKSSPTGKNRAAEDKGVIHIQEVIIKMLTG